MITHYTPISGDSPFSALKTKGTKENKPDKVDELAAPRFGLGASSGR